MHGSFFSSGLQTVHPQWANVTSVPHILKLSTKPVTWFGHDTQKSSHPLLTFNLLQEDLVRVSQGSQFSQSHTKVCINFMYRKIKWAIPTDSIFTYVGQQAENLRFYSLFITKIWEQASLSYTSNLQKILEGVELFTSDFLTNSYSGSATS